MFKKIALTALAAASMSAFGQGMQNSMSGNNWDSKYDTYSIGSTDVSTLNNWELWKIVRHELKGANAVDAYNIDTFLTRLPSDQSMALLAGLANNFKQASIVRDEVAQARFGTDSNYAWLSYPPLTWTDTPGQNSWSALTFTPSNSMSMNSTDGTIAMTDDSSRPMRMVMSNHSRRDIDYDRAVKILSSGLGDMDKGAIHEIFHPAAFDPQTYTNETQLDSVIRVIESNAAMVDHLDRYAWYNHFDKEYYNRHNWNN